MIKKFSELLQHNRIKLLADTYKEWLAVGSRVLDIGCGDGILTEALSRKYDLRITGCDVEKFLLKPIRFVLMKNKNKLPFPDKSFDAVMFNDVLHHTLLPMQYQLLKEATRIARKSILIFEVRPTAGTGLFDFLLNKAFHPSMNVPFTYRDKIGWYSLFARLPAKVDYKECPTLSFSLFSHMAFRLQKFPHPFLK